MVMNGDTGQLALAHADANRKCERCRCPLCMDPSRYKIVFFSLYCLTSCDFM